MGGCDRSRHKGRCGNADCCRRPNSRAETENECSPSGAAGGNDEGILEAAKAREGAVAMRNGAAEESGGEKRGTEGTEESELMHAHRVRAAEASVDPRGRRGENLKWVAENMLKEEPTLPAFSSSGVALHHGGAASAGAAGLPSKHCAFMSCPWQGLHAADLCARVLEGHRGSLERVAGAFLCVTAEESKNEEVRYLLAHSEAVAWKVRQGAPLAALAMDQRCLRACAEGLGGQAVSSLACLLRARKFPRVEGRPGNPIAWQKVSPNQDGIFGLPGAFAKERMSVDSYVGRRGQVGSNMPSAGLCGGG